MKTIKITLLITILLNITTFKLLGQAPAIVTNDCDGISHNLYNELNNGKVIVIGWTMPCSTCAPPLLSVHNAVLNFAISHPNKVEYWVSDDYSNTNCSSIISWCQNNGINNATYFSSIDIKMSDFGATGMPKVVVIGCSNGNVYYNVNNTPNGTGVTNAINNALNDINNGCTVVNIDEAININDKKKLIVYPNPSKNNITVKLPPNSYNSNDKVIITNSIGQVVSSKQMDELNINESQFSIDVSNLPESIYHLRIESTKGILIESFIKSNN